MSKNDQMTKTAKPSRLQQQLGAVLILILIAGFYFGRPAFEQVTNTGVPQNQVGQVSDTPAETSRAVDQKQSSSKSNQTRDKGDSKQTDRRSKSKRSRNRKSDRDKFELKDLGSNAVMTPAGLVYRMGPRGEHRIDHVLRHSKDDRSKPVHGVFAAQSRNDVLRMIDEAYRRIKEKSPGVQAKSTGSRGDRREYIVEMGFVTGYLGGKTGANKNYPKLTGLKLVLQSGNQVVTAFPYRGQRSR